MIARVIGDYGGPYEDYAPVEDPDTELASSYGNLLMEDVAQLTKPAAKAVVRFNTLTTGVPVFASVVGAKLLWGEGVSYYPTVTKAATGRYNVVFNTTYEDGLGEDEAVAFVAAVASLRPNGNPGVVETYALGNIVYIYTYNIAGSPSDLGGGREVTLVAF